MPMAPDPAGVDDKVLKERSANVPVAVVEVAKVKEVEALLRMVEVDCPAILNSVVVPSNLIRVPVAVRFPPKNVSPPTVSLAPGDEVPTPKRLDAVIQKRSFSPVMDLVPSKND